MAVSAQHGGNNCPLSDSIATQKGSKLFFYWVEFVTDEITFKFSLGVNPEPISPLSTVIMSATNGSSSNPPTLDSSAAVSNAGTLEGRSRAVAPNMQLQFPPGAPPDIS